MDPQRPPLPYPFINCTNCGPRFTIIEDIPYDRAQYTMREFSMCAECKAEYQEPSNRRFHAEATGCPACGPRLYLADASGHEIPLDAAGGGERHRPRPSSPA